MIPIQQVLILSAVLFAIGMIGVLVRRNIIVVFMSIELMLNAVNLAFVGFSRQMDSMTGMMFTFFIVVVAAVEAVIGLSLMISLSRQRQTLHVDKFNLLRW